MFCIVYQLPKCKKKKIIKCEGHGYAYFEVFCKTFSKRMQKRLISKLNCPIVLAESITTDELKPILYENMIFDWVRRHSDSTIALVNDQQPEALIERIAPFCKEIHLIASAPTDASFYLRHYGYAPIHLENCRGEDIIYERIKNQLQIHGKTAQLPENGYLMPPEIKEILPSALSELKFLYLLWQYGNFDPQKLLPILKE